MNVLLIAPSSGKWQHVGKKRFFGGKTFRFSMLSLLSVAAETPKEVGIQLVDEQVEEIPWDAEVDLVGITCMTALAPRAYEISSRFRDRGIPVVLGGMHPTFLPEEALQYADAVVVGESEGVWGKVLEDVARGSLSGIYKAESPVCLSGLKRPRRDLLNRDHYSVVYAVQATRGCPHSCAFCSVSAFNGGQQRRRPIEEVVAEVAENPKRFFMFIDDNLTADKEYAKALFEGIAPLRKHWVTQSSLEIVKDPDLVHCAAESGCVGLFVGLETFSTGNLGSVSKTCHKAEEYRESIRILHSHGIGVEAGIVVGFDGDTPKTFSNTLRMLDEIEIDAVQFSILTPLPGTPLSKSMESRILTKDWSQYDFHRVVFEPMGMSPEELQAGHDWLTYEFYRPWRIARRLARVAGRPKGLTRLPYAAAVNLAYYGRVVSWGIRGWDPGHSEARTPAMTPNNWVSSKGFEIEALAPSSSAERR